MGKRRGNKKSKWAPKAKSETQKSQDTATGLGKKRRELADPMPQIIARMPQMVISRDQWEENITMQLLSLWLPTLSPYDSKIAAAPRPGWFMRMSPEARRDLDEIIVRQAGTTGWRIGLSWLVQWRQSEWEASPNGLKLFQRYHSAIERAARIFQRREKPPLNGAELYPFKVATVRELSVLLSEMRDAYRNRLRNPPPEREVVSDFLRIVANRTKSFPFIAANLERWRAFLQEEPTILRQVLAVPRLRPASLFDLWLSWCKGVSEEWLRQVISVGGGSLRKPSTSTKL